MQKLSRNILEWGVLLIVFLIPVLYFGKSWYLPYTSSKVFPMYGLIEIFFALWVYILWVEPSYRLSKKVIVLFLPVIIFIFWLTFCAIMSVSPQMSFWSSIERGTGLITLYHLLAFSLMVASLIKRSTGGLFLNKLIFWFLNGALVVALSVWLGDEGFNLPYEVLQKSKGGGFIGNSSLAAAYLTFAVFFSVFLYFKKDISRNFKIWVITISALIISSPLFLNLYGLFSARGWFVSARAASISILVGIIVSGLVYLVLSKNKKPKVIGVICMVGCVFVFTFGYIQLGVPNTTVHDKFTESIGGNRLMFWGIAKQGISEKPILGWGPENYSVVYQKYFDPHLFLESGTVEIWNDRAHNIIFETGIAGGLPAVVLYLVFLSSIVYAIYGAYKLNNLSRVQASVLIGLVSAYTLQNFFVFDSVSSLLGLFILLGMVYGLNDSAATVQREAELKNRNIILVFLLFATTICFVYFVLYPIQKVKNLSNIFSLSLNKRPEHYKDLLNMSAVGDAREVGKIADDIYLVYAKNKESLRTDPKLLPFVQKDLEKLLEYLDIISKKQPSDYRLHLNLIRLYNIYLYMKRDDVGLVPRIIELGKEAQVLSPRDPQVGWAISQTYVYAKDLAGAEEALKHSIDIAPYLAWSYQFLLNFAEDTNNKKLYDETLINAHKFVPNFTFIKK